MKTLSVASSILLTVVLLAPSRLHAANTTVVGLPTQIKDLVLPGTELEVKPLEDRKAPIVLRIVRVNPHGTALRYDLEYYGLEAGTFDLKASLRRKDRSSAADLPSIPVTIESVLPPGQILPNDLEQYRLPRLGGYWFVVSTLGVVWIVVLVVIWRAGRKPPLAHLTAKRPVTAADRLRPLVEGACAGKLSPSRLAELERTLIVLWKERLGLKDRKLDEALPVLRNHPKAGPLLHQLEIWLHRPGPSEKVDVAILLEPYQNIPAENLEGVAGTS